MNLQLYAIAGVIILLLLTGLLLAARRRVSGSGEVGTPWENVPHEDLFVDIGQETKERLLDAWRWKRSGRRRQTLSRYRLRRSLYSDLWRPNLLA